MAAVSVLLFLTIASHRWFSFRTNQEMVTTQSVGKNETEQEIKIPTVDTDGWESYRSQWYGFSLKYPDGWEKPVVQKVTKNSKWDYQYRFRRKETDDSNRYLGFNVVVYDVKKIKELTKTEEYPSFRNKMNENENI